MTHAARTFHRRTVGALAALLPLVILGAIAVRTPGPPASVIPAAAEVPDGAVRTLFAADDLWRRARITTRIRILPGDPDRHWIELEPREEFAHADLLLYWSPSRPRERVSPSARLLGAFRGHGAQRFVVPDAVHLRSGYLILFDLAHAEIFGVAEVPVPL